MLSFNTIGYLINNHCIKCGMGAFEKLVTGFSEAAFLYKKKPGVFSARLRFCQLIICS